MSEGSNGIEGGAVRGSCGANEADVRGEVNANTIPAAVSMSARSETFTM